MTLLLTPREDLTNGNGMKLRLWVPVMLWILSTLITVAVAFGAVATRVSVLEDRYERLADDIREIKGDLKTLLRQMRN